MNSRPKNYSKIFKGAGMNWKRIKFEPRQIKIGIALVVSNIFFFLLFSGGDETTVNTLIPGYVEIEVRGELSTSFAEGKKVSVINKRRTIKVDAQLLRYHSEPDSKVLLQVDEKDAHQLLAPDNWEIFPLLSTYQVALPLPKEAHEIRY
jgi:hypothetical protein